MPGVGLEPTRPFGLALLRRLRLPFRHPGLRGCYPGYDAEPWHARVRARSSWERSWPLRFWSRHPGSRPRSAPHTEPRPDTHGTRGNRSSRPTDGCSRSGRAIARRRRRSARPTPDRTWACSCSAPKPAPFRPSWSKPAAAEPEERARRTAIDRRRGNHRDRKLGHATPVPSLPPRGAASALGPHQPQPGQNLGSRQAADRRRGPRRLPARGDRWRSAVRDLDLRGHRRHPDRAQRRQRRSLGDGDGRADDLDAVRCRRGLRGPARHRRERRQRRARLDRDRHRHPAGAHVGDRWRRLRRRDSGAC